MKTLRSSCKATVSRSWGADPSASMARETRCGNRAGGVRWLVLLANQFAEDPQTEGDGHIIGADELVRARGHAARGQHGRARVDESLGDVVFKQTEPQPMDGERFHHV